jgi:hypothetical protein
VYESQNARRADVKRALGRNDAGLEIPWTGLITLIVPPTWRRRPDNERLPHVQFTLQDVVT